jgi:PiT family inorganic phosphate transporter
MIEYLDVKPIMMYIVMGMILLFILTYTYQHVKFKNRPSSAREAGMHKKLQLLSSAAFSLGHGGADSQKVMGIICAALLVYGNTARKEGQEQQIKKDFAITELMQVEYKKEGKLEKYKPEVATIQGDNYYKSGGAFIEGTSHKTVFDKSGKSKGAHPKHSMTEIKKSLHKIEVYTDGKDLYDHKTKELIFKKNKLNTAYSNAFAFKPVVDDKNTLKEGFKIKTKVHSDTMPFWIAFGCYLMIGLGTLMGGWKIVKTMGSRITKVTPLEGVCAETAGALTLFTVSNFGIPVSTTHTITGSIIGVGATKRLSAVRWGVTINLLWAWILTIPVSALLAALVYAVIYVCK